MNADELSFVNRQLESMVKSGIPLEGALKEVVQNLKNGRLRLQLDTVIHSLENGTSLDDAIKDVELPVAYKRILTSGAASGNMGQALNAAAEFFQAQSLAMRQLSTALFYPLITLVVLFCVSVLVGLTTTFLVVSISDPADQSVKMQLLDVSDASAFEMITLLFTTRPGTAIQVWIVPIMLLIFFNLVCCNIWGEAAEGLDILGGAGVQSGPHRACGTAIGSDSWFGHQLARIIAVRLISVSVNAHWAGTSTLA
ncbi:MAG: type II secretion system F family protein [Verrucomicrobia bacterium]|nr:type II secretion system F family protein [Verrucomicrobiota bacterium]